MFKQNYAKVTTVIYQTQNYAMYQLLMCILTTKQLKSTALTSEVH